MILTLEFWAYFFLGFSGFCFGYAFCTIIKDFEDFW